MSTNCPTCGPTVTEQHPRQSVTRCANCKEWLSTNDSTPDPTAGEPCYCGKRRDEDNPGCVYHQARNPATPDADDASERRWRDPQTGALGPIHDPVCAALSYDDEDSCSCGALDADASTPASEGPTEAERDSLWEVIACIRDHAPRTPGDADTDDIIDGILDSGWLDRYLTARVADAEAKARADERERIAQAIRAAADEQVWPKYLAARKQVDQALYQGKFDGMADAAHIARGDG